MNPADVPMPAIDKHGDDRWMCMHKQFLAETKEKEPDVVFIGDFSIALMAHTEAWEKLFVPLHCLNFGIPEDQTQNVLWRIENGEIETVNPKVIVLSVGANNHEHSAQQIVKGIEACVKAISTKQPKASVIVLKLLPCGKHNNPIREKIIEVNHLLPEVLRNVPKVELLNVDPGFVQGDGTISHHDMYDYVHLTPQAYMNAFNSLADLIQQLLDEVLYEEFEADLSDHEQQNEHE